MSRFRSDLSLGMLPVCACLCVCLHGCQQRGSESSPPSRVPVTMCGASIFPIPGVSCLMCVWCVTLRESSNSVGSYFAGHACELTWFCEHSGLFSVLSCFCLRHAVMLKPAFFFFPPDCVIDWSIDFDWLVVPKWNHAPLLNLALQPLSPLLPFQTTDLLPFIQPIVAFTPLPLSYLP